MTTKKRTFFTTVASAVDILGKSLLEWIGAPGGLATLDSSSNLEQPAKKIATSRTINGVAFDGSANIHHFGVCSTAGETTAKVVTIPGFVLATGAVATVKFTYTNTAIAPTLDVNSTGAKTILYNGIALSTYVLEVLSGGNPIELIYDGNNYHIKNPVTAGAIDAGTISRYHLDDLLSDTIDPLYNNYINGPVYLKISALQMSTPTDDAWVSYPTTLAVWDAVKNAVTNGIPVYLVDLYPLATNTNKYLCTVMYYQNHGRIGVGSFLFQYNRSSTTISGFKLSRVGSTFSCVSF